MSKTLIFRIFIAASALLGVSLQISQDGFGMLLYYTLLSNLLVAGFLIFLITRQFKTKQVPDSKTVLRLKGGVTMSILITGVIYHYMLAPLVEPHEFWNLRNFLVHYIVPVGFLLDTLVIDQKRSYKLIDPWLWTAVPLLYSVFAMINGLVLKMEVPGSSESPFPYFFVNGVAYGWNIVGIYILCIFVTYVAAGYLLLLLKKFLGQNTK